MNSIRLVKLLGKKEAELFSVKVGRKGREGPLHEIPLEKETTRSVGKEGSVHWGSGLYLGDVLQGVEVPTALAFVKFLSDSLLKASQLN